MNQIEKKMIIRPKYPNNIFHNPFFVGIGIGFLMASGFILMFYLNSLAGTIYSLLLFSIGVYLYLKFNQIFN